MRAPESRTKKPVRSLMKKEIAALAGVAVRTLSRLERGEKVSERTRRRVARVMEDGLSEDPVGADPSEPDVLRELKLAHDALPIDARYDAWELAPIVVQCVFGPAIIFPWRILFGSDPVSGDVWAAVLAVALLAIEIAVASWFFRPAARRIRSNARKRTLDSARRVLEEIRRGTVTRLTKWEYEVVARDVGPVVLEQTLARAPKRVRVDPF